VYPGVNKFYVGIGPRFTFHNMFGVSPFVFGEGGQIRTTNKATDVAAWNTAATAGFGFNYFPTPRFGFQVIPGEYYGTHLDTGDWEHSYMTRLGIVFNFFGKPY
jgi:hypothetical protein